MYRTTCHAVFICLFLDMSPSPLREQNMEGERIQSFLGRRANPGPTHDRTGKKAKQEVHAMRQDIDTIRLLVAKTPSTRLLVAGSIDVKFHIRHICI